MNRITEKRCVVILVLKVLAFIVVGLVAAVFRHIDIALACLVCAVVCYVGAILSEQIRKISVTTEWESPGVQP